jgi:hypothetical protein
VSLLSLLQQTLTVKKAGAVNDFGQKATASTITLQARIEKTNRLILDSNGGRESQVIARVFVKSDADVVKEDLVTLDGEDMIVLDVASQVGGLGAVHHKELLVGRRRV